MSQDFFAPCPRGLEEPLAQELRALGAEQVDIFPGGVGMRGDWTLCYRANLESRLATRILWRVGRARYRDADDIYALAGRLGWERWFTPAETLRVQVTARRSPLKSLEFVTLRIKDAVCDRMRARLGHRPSIDTVRPDVRVHAFLTRDTVTLYLDTSGEPLYKRGFKHATVEAPLKENLAAGILQLSGWKSDEPFVDPMCGSGTFLLEAAQMALNVAPGLGRRFGFEKLRKFDRKRWERLQQQARARAASPRALPIVGADVAPEKIRGARTNLDAAGLLECVRLLDCDILDLEPPAESGVMVTNPPYGVRIGEAEALAELYPRIGDALKARWAGWRCCFLSADPALPKAFRLKPRRKTPLFNGALECRLFEYRMFAGTERDARKDGLARG